MSTDLKGRLKEKAGAVAERPKNLADQIMALAPQLAKALPRHMSSERMARIALTEFRKNPELGKCTPHSLFGSLLTASQLGLEPGPLGHCYLIPYKGQVSLQLGYRGMLELVSRSDKVDSVYAYAVYKGDEFTYKLGTDPLVEHIPGANTDDDALIAVYAVAHIKGSTIPRIEVMNRKQVDAIRARAQARSNGPWVTDYAEMARKTVLKKLCKTLPLAAEIALSITQDDTIRPSFDSEETASIFEITGDAEQQEAGKEESGDGKV